MSKLGIRHLALRVKDLQRSREFYENFLGMQVDWEPNPENVYLTTAGQDNLALHQVAQTKVPDPLESLDHFGFVVSTKQEVDEFYQKALSLSLPIVKTPKDHRDGARSFYLKDPDGVVVQIICQASRFQTKLGDKSLEPAG
ncbi:MAG: VOC family protein [Deltaproteobacteria bacterium]|nr:VOC family protein [Deltaproteobacteria bacterium]